MWLLVVDGCWYFTEVWGSANILRLHDILSIKHIRLKRNKELGRVGELYP